MPSVGDYINPHKMFSGCFVPEWLMGMSAVPAAAKLLYAQLARYAGANGAAWPALGTLADDLCISRKYVCDLVKKLKEANLIEVVERKADDGGQQSNVYKFRWVQQMEDSLRQDQITGDGGGEQKFMGGTNICSPKENHESKDLQVQDKEEEQAMVADDPPAGAVFPQAQELQKQLLEELSYPIPVSGSVTRRLQLHLNALPNGYGIRDILGEVSSNIEAIRQKVVQQNAGWNYLLGNGGKSGGVIGKTIERWHQEIEVARDTAKRDRRDRQRTNDSWKEKLRAPSLSEQYPETR